MQFIKAVLGKVWHLHSKNKMFGLHNWVFSSFLYTLICFVNLCLKEKYAKNIKSKKNPNAFNMVTKRVSRRCESYMMYFKGDGSHQTVMIVCECI